MSEFQPIGLQHKALFDERLSREDSKSSSESFGNVFLWSDACPRYIAPVGDRLCIEYRCSKGSFYAYPLGRGELVPAIDALRKRADAQGTTLSLRCVTEGQRLALEAAFPGRFRFTEDRDNFDYIYSVESFATLAGKKFHGKRNYCNRFESANEWRYEPLSPANFPACRELLRLWNAEKNGGSAEESEAIERMFRFWDSLDMLGGVLFANENPVAFTAGELLSRDTVDVHFEKALDGIPGAYPMIAREFARQIQAEQPMIRYLNREEDMGIPGLRKAKEDWYPVCMIEKYTALWQENAP